MFGEQTTIHIGELLNDAQRLATTQRDIHNIKGVCQIVWEVWAILLGISLDAGGEQVFLEDASIFCKETEQQTSNENVEIVQVIVTTELIIGSKFVMQFG